jgi:hypothetical protein
MSYHLGTKDGWEENHMSDILLPQRLSRTDSGIIYGMAEAMPLRIVIQNRWFSVTVMRAV